MARDDYKWNTNSRDEKQSSYTESGYATSSFEPSQAGDAKRRAKRNHRSRLGPLLGIIGIVIALSAALLYGVSKFLRG